MDSNDYDDQEDLGTNDDQGTTFDRVTMSSTTVSNTTSNCSAVCCNVLHYEPVQMSSTAILKQTRKIQGKKSRKFLADWFKMYPWLLLCTTRLKAFCSFCRYSFQNGFDYREKGRRYI